MKTSMFLWLAVAGLGLVGCASTSAQQKVVYTPLRPYSACLDTSRVREWYVNSPKSLVVSADTHYYRVKLRVRCEGVGLGGGIRFKVGTRSGDRPRVCGNLGDAVYSNAGIACPIQTVTPITKQQFRAAEAAAIHQRD